MKTITSLVLAGSLAVATSLATAKEHEEENVSKSDVPAAVQKTGEAEAKGGKLVRWEKEGRNYEAVIDKNGKQWGVEIDASGKVLNKHDESKEHGEKGEKHHH
jgi:plastocyanin